jgi:hypothetical protein
VEGAGGDVEADLRRMEGGGHVRADGLALDLAGRGVDSGGHVAGDHRRARRVDRRYRARDRLARRALEAGAEHRVHDRSRSLEALGLELLGRRTGQALEVRARVALGLGEVAGGEHVDRAPLLAQQPRGREPVAAVVALAADDPDREPGLGDRRRGPRQAGRGALHQVDRRHPGVLDGVGVGGPHLVGREEGVEPVGRHGRERTGPRLSSRPGVAGVIRSTT